MNPSDFMLFVPGALYRVRIRSTNFDTDSRKVVHTVHRRATRRFLRREMRFQSIPCAVFSAPITKRHHGNASEVSVPHYDIVEATPDN
jgi:hypothetical protein